MDKNSCAPQTQKANEEDTFDELFLEQQTQMQEDLRIWKEAKRIWRTKIIFFIWIAILFAFGTGFAIVLFRRNILPDPQIFEQHNILTTPGTAWFLAGLLGFLVEKICKDKYWTLKSTFAASIGYLLGLIPLVQVGMVQLFYLLVMKPIAFILSVL